MSENALENIFKIIMWSFPLTIEGAVPHSQGNWSLRLALDVGLCGVCVVVFGLYNVLLALDWMHGNGPDPGREEENTVKYNTIHSI